MTSRTRVRTLTQIPVLCRIGSRAQSPRLQCEHILYSTTRVQTQIRIPNLIATLYYPENVHITQTWTQIPTPYFCTGQESESESASESVSGNIHEA